MSLSIGIVGLPNVGKSTLFNALSKNAADANNYPFCTIDPNVGVVTVPDKRLDELTDMSKSKKTIHATIEFVDIAGLVQGASQGEGLGNQFLSHIRNVNAIAHVVRCFYDKNIIHVSGTVNPEQDMDIINLELILADLTTTEKRISMLEKKAKSNDKESINQLAFFTRCKDHLEQQKPIRTLQISSMEKKWLKEIHLLTYKPVIYVANVSEDVLLDPKNPLVESVRKRAETEQASWIVVSSRIESEISQLEPDEARELLVEYGIEHSGLDLLIQKSYEMLELMTFLTTGPSETRAWTIGKGTKAPQAAGVIHTDFERGFIKAEVIHYEELIGAGGYAQAREKGLIRLEGKDYIIQEGDVVLFKFNV